LSRSWPPLFAWGAGLLHIALGPGVVHSAVVVAVALYDVGIATIGFVVG
jgi:hypothetical protein